VRDISKVEIVLMQGELKGETQKKSMTDSHDVPLADVGNSISKCHRNIKTI